MEEQNTAGPVEETSQQDTVSVAEESQPEVTESNVVSEEEADVQETEPEKTEAPEDEQSQEQAPEEDIPFHERPGVKKRLEDIETKYGSKAQYWDTISDIAKQDPEFRVAVLEKLEAQGRLPKGTVEAEKKKTSSLQQSEEYINQLPEDVQADLKAAREFRQQRELQQKQALSQAEEFFVSFEEQRPDIAESPNPDRARNLIYNLATDIVEKDGVEFETAMDEAYQVILHRGENQNNAIKRKVQQVQEDAGAVPAGGPASNSKIRKLSQAEKRAAEMAGMSYEEYVKYADTPADELFENI